MPGPSLAAGVEVDTPALAAATLPEPTLASPQPPAPPADTPAEQNDTDLVLAYGERRYRVRG